MPGSFMIYGANGYTGALIARLAAERGLRPLLAGRNPAALAAVATRYGLEYRVAALDDTGKLDAALRDVTAVLHCAGPFAHTSQPMAEACLRTGTHYLDITGEIAVFEALAQRDVQAQAAGILLLPGVGFDVVPSDCLALHLKQRLPGAQRLTLAFQALGRASWGTSTTAVESLNRAALARRDGHVVELRGAPRTRAIDFGHGPVPTRAIGWGDVATAYYSTGIPNIEVYTSLGAAARLLLSLSGTFGGALTGSAAQRLLKRLIRLQPPGPTDAERARGQSLLWGEVEDAAGERRSARLRTPEGYTLTATTALAITERVLAGQLRHGFHTPAQLYGADFILEFPGVVRVDLEVTH